MEDTMIIQAKNITFPANGQYRATVKAAIRAIKAGYDGALFIIRADGRLERYQQTNANKQGWFKLTYDPSHNRKRPGIPQYRIDWNENTEAA
jgi:hypothetical protein